jgi:hypothetical protein
MINYSGELRREPFQIPIQLKRNHINVNKTPDLAPKINGILDFYMSLPFHPFFGSPRSATTFYSLNFVVMLHRS